MANELTTKQESLLTEATSILKANKSLSKKQKEDVIALLQGDSFAKIKMAEAIIEGKWKSKF